MLLELLPKYQKRVALKRSTRTAADLMISQQIFAVEYMHESLYTKLLYQQGGALLCYADVPERFAKLLTY